MADYDISTVQVDPSALKQSWKKMASHDPVGLTPFSQALNTAANFANLFGPTVDVALSGSPKASGIFNGVLSGFMGGMSGSPYANWSLPGSTPTIGGTMVGGGYGFKGLGEMPSTAPGYPGTGAYTGGSFSTGSGISSAGYGLTGMSSDTANLESQANSLMGQNMYYLALQTKLSQVNMVTQAMSNIEKVRAESITSVIRNIGH